MVFALGVLAAGLCALLILPALHARAERLARRRVEALFPMSIAELTAEKDHLRAEFAVVQRRLERRVDEALAGKQADRDELGRRTVRAEALAQTLEARDTAIATLESELASTCGALATAQGRIAEQDGTIEVSAAALAALEDGHRALLAEHAAHLNTREALDAGQAGLRSALDEAGVREAALMAEHARLQQRHADALAEGDVRRIALSDLQTRLLAQSTRGDELERRLDHATASDEPAERRILDENAELRRMIADVADRVTQARTGAHAGAA